MKKIVLLLIIIFTNNAFSQITDNKSLIADMNNFYNKRKIEKLEVLTSEILSGKYGSMDDELKFYALMYSSNVYSSDEYAKKDSQKGYDKVFELLVFAKSTSYAIPNKETYIKSMSDYLLVYKNKHPEVKESVKEIENNTVAVDKTETVNKTAETTNTPKSTSDDKTVTLTVSGTGKTLEEARLNALRSAIEQAFGAFISSKTEILNDNLVKDEIVSISNGNIEKYEIISQVEIPNNGFAMTLNATVSISKLTTFAESKGVTVEFKGGMFAMNIKLKELNEEAEYIAIGRLCIVLFDMLKDTYDYNLTVSEPRLNIDTNKYRVNFRISTAENKNYENLMNYFISTINKIALTEAEASEIENIGKQSYSFIIDNKLYKLRSFYSMLYLHNFFIGASLMTTNSFGVFTNSGEIVKIRSRAESIINAKIDEYGDFKLLFEDVSTDKKENYNSTKFISSDWTSQRDLQEWSKLTLISKFKSAEFCFDKKFSLSELEKISTFSIKKMNFFDIIKNRNLYFMQYNKNDYTNEVFHDEKGEIITNPDRDDDNPYESCR